MPKEDDILARLCFQTFRQGGLFSRLFTLYNAIRKSIKIILDNMKRFKKYYDYLQVSFSNFFSKENYIRINFRL